LSYIPAADRHKADPRPTRYPKNGNIPSRWNEEHLLTGDKMIVLAEH